MTMKRKAHAPYPEHDKLKAISERSQTVGEFIEWLRGEKGISLASYHDHTLGCFSKKDQREAHKSLEVLCDDFASECGMNPDRLYERTDTITDLLAAFFKIDQNKIEEEKRVMLEELRKRNAGVTP